MLVFARKALLIALAIVLFPVAMLAGLLTGPRKRTPEEMAAELKRLADGDISGWDDFECGGPIKDTRLEAIRQEALMAVELPLRPSDREMLATLAKRAAALSA